MPQVRLHNTREAFPKTFSNAFLNVFLIVSALLLIPFSAMAQRGGDDDSGSIGTGGTGGSTGGFEPYFMDGDQDIQVTAEGSGWKTMTISDPTEENRAPEVIVAIWPGGQKTAPLSAAQKAELNEDFGNMGDPYSFKVQSTHVILLNKDLADAMENGESMARWMPYADDETDPKFGCSGWKTKTKTESWSINEPYHSDTFNLTENISGNYSIEIPVQGQSTLELTYSYKRNAICIPYKFRFDQARMHGNLDISGDSLLNASVSAQGHWEDSKQLANPKLGDIKFWIGPIPIKINFHLPIDIGYTIDASAQAALSVGSNLDSSGTFDYTCTQDTCWGSNTFSDPLDEEGIYGSIEVDAQARIWAQIKLRANVYSDNFLYAEAGARGFVEGDFWGYYGNNCGDGDGDGINETVQALAVGADAGYDWVYGIGGIINDREWLSAGNRYYLGWWDLLGEGGSTALSPMIEGPSEVTVGQMSEFNIRMRPCYPYTDAVTFAMAPNQWTGDMTLENPQTSVQTTGKIFGAAQAYDIRALAVRDAKGRSLRVPQWRRIHAGYPEPPPALELSYIPLGGGERRTYRSFEPGVQPTQEFFYDSSLGNFEERPGGACQNGSNNYSYVKLTYDGPPMSSCSFETHNTSGSTPCSQALVDYLNAGNELTINTDNIAIDPATCEPVIPTTGVCGPGEYCWLLLDMVIDGETQRRSVAYRHY